MDRMGRACPMVTPKFGSPLPMAGALGQRQPAFDVSCHAVLGWAPRATRVDKPVQTPPQPMTPASNDTRLALFDLDNTLVDRQGAFERWARSFASRRGLGVEAIDVLCDADDDGFAPRQDVFAAARRHLHLHETVEELVSQYRAEYPEMFRPDEAVLAALRGLRARRWRLGIVTNGPATQHEKVRRAGLAPLVDACCVSDELGVQKPDPQIFLEAARRCCEGPVAVGSAWMIGDSPAADIAGGNGAGLRTVWLHRGRAWSRSDVAPDLIASDIADAVTQIIATTP